MILKLLLLTTIVCYLIIVIQCNRQILRDESIIHLKFFDNPIIRLSSNNDSNLLAYKVSAFDLDQGDLLADDNLAIFVLNDQQNHFVRQSPNGHPYDPDEFVLISVNVTRVDQTVIIIDYFEFINQTNWGSIGFSHITPFANTSTDGMVTAAIVDDNDKAIGSVEVDYLIIRPIRDFDADSPDQIKIKAHAMMGHRGTGVGRRTDLKENILENTIEAFNYACRHHADMIELDIQLSQDKIPIIHHNFDTQVYVRNNRGNGSIKHTIAVKNIPLAQMSEISTVESKDFDYDDNQPFETLENVLKQVDPGCGINFEIKYPQTRQNGKWESEKCLELNEYLDIIVKTLYDNIGNRTGIITSFHADLCSMIHLKQNKLSVALLTSGDIQRWDPKAIPYADPRGTTIPLGAYFADGMGFDGMSIKADDLLANKTLVPFVKSLNQNVYVWGGLIKSIQVMDQLKDMGVDGLIFDKIDKLLDQTSANFDNK